MASPSAAGCDFAVVDRKAKVGAALTMECSARRLRMELGSPDGAGVPGR